MGPMEFDGTKNMRAREVLKTSAVRDGEPGKGEDAGGRANTGAKSVIKSGASKAKDAGSRFPAIAGVIQTGDGRSA